MPKSNDTKKSLPKHQPTWGKKACEFYAGSQGQTVTVALVTGKALVGTLIGVDTYDLVIRQDKTSLELLVPKGNVLYVHR